MKHWPWLAGCAAVYLAHSVVAYKARGLSWAVPASLALSVVGAVLWILLARRCTPAELLPVGMWWDLIVTVIFLGVSAAYGAFGGLSPAQAWGWGFVVVGLILTKIA